MFRTRLLAIDIDGTLLRADGQVAPEDRDAIATALSGGMAVTLATGRLSSSTLPFARSLGLRDPLVCADGAVLFCPVREQPLELTVLATPTLAAFRRRLREWALAPFLFTHDTLFGAQADADRFPWTAGWSPRVAPRDDLEGVLGGGEGPIVTAIGIAPAEEPARVAEAAVREDAMIMADVTVFPVKAPSSGPQTNDHWVVRLTPRGCNKAAGLARVAARLGIAADEVAAVGDWHNDVDMLAWAGSSFAMGHAPDEVKSAAKRTLSATPVRGGGVAEALGLLSGC